MRIPKDASPEVKAIFKQLIQEIRRLQEQVRELRNELAKKNGA